MKYSSGSDTSLPFLFHSILIAFLVLIFNFVAYAAQTDILQKSISLQLGNTTVGKTLESIEAQTGYAFSYSSNLIHTDRKVFVSYRDTPLQRILHDILGDVARGLLVEGKQIKIQPSTGKGSVKGSVSTIDGQSAGFVTIGIRGQRSTQADDQGHFSLEDVQTGTYVITASYIGLKTQQQTVTVETGRITSISFTLSEDAKTLQEVIVEGSQINKPVDKDTEYVARMPLSNLENSQVYSIVDQKLMKQQVAFNVSQAVSNAAGAVPTEHDSGGLTVLTRGFRTGINARNGMETTSSRTSVDIANIERIEVLKGPSGTLFGSSISSFGGVVNVVTKKPFAQRQTEVSYTTGSFGLNRLSADINTPLNADKTALFRINTAANKENSFLDAGFNNTFLLAPSLRYQVNERLSFAVDAEFYAVNKTQPWYSMSSAETGFKTPADLPIPYANSMLSESADAKNTTTKVFAESRYQFSENWKSTTLFSFAGEDIDHSYQLFASWSSPTKMTPMITNYGPITQNFVGLQQNINGQFSTGAVRHKLVVGANYRFFASNYSVLRGTLEPIDITESYEPFAKSNIDRFLTESRSLIADQHTISAYASDVVNFTDRLSLMLSLRLDHFNRKEIVGTEGFNQTSFAPKLGIVYQIVKNQLSFFGNYMSGFQNEAPVNQPDGSRLILNPTFANQSEVGVKGEFFEKKLSLTTSYYHIGIDNAVNYGNDGFVVQGGKQISKGMEFEIIALPIPGLNIHAGYVYNDNRITENIDPVITGNFATDAPQHVANTWLSYTLQHSLRGLGIGIGGNHVGKSYLFSDNQYHTPRYTAYQATVFYEQSKWRIGVKVNNLTNERYWGLWGMPQAPRNVAGNLTFRF